MTQHSHNGSAPRAWVVDVNMGYGHSRAAFALKDLAGGHILSANDYAGIPAQDRKRWQESRKLYEFISRMKPLPLVGDFLFEAMDHWQEIPSFYPRRDLSKPNAQLAALAQNAVPFEQQFQSTRVLAGAACDDRFGPVSMHLKPRVFTRGRVFKLAPRSSCIRVSDCRQFVRSSGIAQQME
jgi:hypothetical protein